MPRIPVFSPDDVKSFQKALDHYREPGAYEPGKWSVSPLNRRADVAGTFPKKVVLRDMPLEAIHPQAFKAAEASRCAGEQGKFWEMHDRLFTNQNALARKDLSAHAQALGLDGAAFDQFGHPSAVLNVRNLLPDSFFVFAGKRFEKIGTREGVHGITDSCLAGDDLLRAHGKQGHIFRRDAQSFGPGAAKNSFRAGKRGRQSRESDSKHVIEGLLPVHGRAGRG